MTERTEGQQLVDIFVETAHANAEITKALREAYEDEKKATKHIEAVFDEQGLSASDALDIVHGTDASILMRLERLNYLHQSGRPSLLEVAQLAFHTTARERVTALVDGRSITVTSLNPQSEELVMQAPVISVNLNNSPGGITGEITDYYSQLDRLILTADHPIAQTPENDTPRTQDDLFEDSVPADIQYSTTVQVAPVARVSPYTNEFKPQVAININPSDQAA